MSSGEKQHLLLYLFHLCVGVCCQGEVLWEVWTQEPDAVRLRSPKVHDKLLGLSTFQRKVVCWAPVSQIRYLLSADSSLFLISRTTVVLSANFTIVLVLNAGTQSWVYREYRTWPRTHPCAVPALKVMCGTPFSLPVGALCGSSGSSYRNCGLGPSLWSLVSFAVMTVLKA